MNNLICPNRLAAALTLVATLVPPGEIQARSMISATGRLETGSLLVARPGMADPNFARTVVLLLSYGEDGAIGVILNRPTPHSLSEVLPRVERLAERSEVLFKGGPVAVNQLLFALRIAEPPADCRPVLIDVCAGGFSVLERALEKQRSASQFRGFAGYAGWAPGQLEWEVEQNGWYVLPGDSRLVFDSAFDEMWSELVRAAESPVA